MADKLKGGLQTDKRAHRRDRHRGAEAGELEDDTLRDGDQAANVARQLQHQKGDEQPDDRQQRQNKIQDHGDLPFLFMIISIGRECGSGGHEIGEKLAKHYGITLYDRNLTEKLAEETNQDPEKLAQIEENGAIRGSLPTLQSRSIAHPCREASPDASADSTTRH